MPSDGALCFLSLDVWGDNEKNYGEPRQGQREIRFVCSAVKVGIVKVSYGGRYPRYGSAQRGEAAETTHVASLKASPNAKKRTEGEEETRRRTFSILATTENTICLPHVPSTVRGYRVGCGYGMGLYPLSKEPVQDELPYLGRYFSLTNSLWAYTYFTVQYLDRIRKVYQKVLMDGTHLTDAECLCSKVSPVSYCTCIHASYGLLTLDPYGSLLGFGPRHSLPRLQEF